MLRCCQKVYHISNQAIYSDNILLLWIDPDRDLRFLSTTFPSWQIFDEMMGDPDSYDKKFWFKIARKFQRMLVRVETSFAREGKNAAPIVASITNIVKDKDVLYDISSIEALYGRESVHTWVRACQSWRYKSFEVIGSFGEDDTVIRSCADVVVSHCEVRELVRKSRLLVDIEYELTCWDDKDEARLLSEQLAQSALEHDELKHVQLLVKIPVFVRKVLEKNRQRKTGLMMLSVNQAQEEVGAERKQANKRVAVIETEYQSRINKLGQ